MADKTTIIGEKTKISGNLEGDEDLVVKGRVEGNIKLSKTLHVESGGIVVADVDVKDCVVAGVVVGDIMASDSVHITNGGRMVGDIKAPRVIIVAGAAFRGRVDMGDMESERTERPRKAPKIEVEDRTAKRPGQGKEDKPAAGIAGMDFGGRKPPVVRPAAPSRTAVAPRVASAAGGKPPAPPAPPLPSGKRSLKKK